IVLRGGPLPNYGHLDVMYASTRLLAAGLPGRVMIDCGHGNAQGQHQRQMDVARDIAAQLAAGSRDILAVSLESNLLPGCQSPHGPVVRGVSITDPCLGLEETAGVLETLSAACASTRR